MTQLERSTTKTRSTPIAFKSRQRPPTDWNKIKILFHRLTFAPPPSTLLNEILATPMERIRGYTAIKTPTKDLLRKERTGKRRAENKEEEGTEAGQMRRRGVGAGKWQLEQLRVIAPRLAQRGHKPPPEVCRATGCPSYAESKEEILIRDARRRATTVISPHARNRV